MGGSDRKTFTDAALAFLAETPGARDRDIRTHLLSLYPEELVWSSRDSSALRRRKLIVADDSGPARVWRVTEAGLEYITRPEGLLAPKSPAARAWPLVQGFLQRGSETWVLADPPRVGPVPGETVTLSAPADAYENADLWKACVGTSAVEQRGWFAKPCGENKYRLSRGSGSGIVVDLERSPHLMAALRKSCEVLAADRTDSEPGREAVEEWMRRAEARLARAAMKERREASARKKAQSFDTLRLVTRDYQGEQSVSVWTVSGGAPSLGRKS